MGLMFFFLKREATGKISPDEIASRIPSNKNNNIQIYFINHFPSKNI